MNNLLFPIDTWKSWSRYSIFMYAICYLYYFNLFSDSLVAVYWVQVWWYFIHLLNESTELMDDFFEQIQKNHPWRKVNQDVALNEPCCSSTYFLPLFYLHPICVLNWWYIPHTLEVFHLPISSCISYSVDSCVHYLISVTEESLYPQQWFNYIVLSFLARLNCTHKFLQPNWGAFYQ